jgi:hypothetical protein
MFDNDTIPRRSGSSGWSSLLCTVPQSRVDSFWRRTKKGRDFLCDLRVFVMRLESCFAGFSWLITFLKFFCHHRYDPTIESTYHKTIRFRKVHFATDIVDTAGMVSLVCFRKTVDSSR